MLSLAPVAVAPTPAVPADAAGADPATPDGGGFAQLLQQARQARPAQARPAPTLPLPGAPGEGTPTEALMPDAQVPDAQATPTGVLDAPVPLLPPPWLPAAPPPPPPPAPTAARAAEAAPQGTVERAVSRAAGNPAPMATAAPAAPAQGMPNPVALASTEAPAATPSTPLATTAPQLAPVPLPQATVPNGPNPQAAPPEPVPATVPVPLADPGFGPALGATLAVLVRDGVEHARLELHPAEMGPVSARIEVQAQAAHIEFVCDLPATREALEASLPALAAALRDSGLTLAGGGVFDRPRQPREQAGGAPAGGRGQAGNAAAEPLPALAAALPRARGVVDLVA